MNDTLISLALPEGEPELDLAPGSLGRQALKSSLAECTDEGLAEFIDHGPSGTIIAVSATASTAGTGPTGTLMAGAEAPTATPAIGAQITGGTAPTLHEAPTQIVKPIS